MTSNFNADTIFQPLMFLFFILIITIKMLDTSANDLYMPRSTLVSTLTFVSSFLWLNSKCACV